MALLRWQPPRTRDFDGFKLTSEGGTPDFFHQNESRGCGSDYLDALGHFRFGFGAGDILEEVVTTPLKRRGLSMEIPN